MSAVWIPGPRASRVSRNDGRPRMPLFICTACGMQFADTAQPPAQCSICEEERQYVPPRGQTWTTFEALRGGHMNAVHAHAPNVIGIGAAPNFAIGQRA